jgi:hypothetical protein
MLDSSPYRPSSFGRRPESGSAHSARAHRNFRISDPRIAVKLLCRVGRPAEARRAAIPLEKRCSVFPSFRQKKMSPHVSQYRSSKRRWLPSLVRASRSIVSAPTQLSGSRGSRPAPHQRRGSVRQERKGLRCSEKECEARKDVGAVSQRAEVFLQSVPNPAARRVMPAPAVTCSTVRGPPDHLGLLSAGGGCHVRF